MDFAVCPACKQSVLDDDAENCPFCGSSMKAKPGKAKPALPVPPASPSPKSAVTKTRPATSLRSESEKSFGDETEDSPFDFGEHISAPAIPVSAQRTKSRTFQVKCPMCETQGYVSPDAVGQSVKCANPKCLVPIFKVQAPETPKPVSAAPKAKPKRSLLVVAGITVVLMSVLGGLAWWISRQPHHVALREPSAEDLELLKQDRSGSQTSQTENASATPDEVTTDSSKAEQDLKTTQAWVTGLMKSMVDASLQNRQNRSKPFCRRLTAEAFAIRGDLKSAQDQMTVLGNVGKDVPYYQITPLVEIGWQELLQGDSAAAAKSVDQAWKDAAKLPKTGRDRLESVILLSALLVAMDREADANSLLERHSVSDGSGQLAVRHRAALSFGTFDLSDADARRPALGWASPLSIGVVYELVARGQADKARSWAMKRPGARERAEAIAAWTEGVIIQSRQHSSDVDVKALQQAIADVPEPGSGLAMSRLGLACSFAGKKDVAEECFTSALDQLNKTTDFPEDPLPEDMATMAKSQPHDPAPRLFLAAATAEASHLAARLSHAQAAEALLQKSLSAIRSLAPNLAAVQKRLKETDALSISTLREEIQKQLKLKTREDAIVAANAYKRNLDDWKAAAQSRLEFQVQLLREAVAWGLLDPVWNAIRPESGQSNDLFLSDLPRLLVEHYKSHKKTEQADAVTSAWQQLLPDHPLVSSLESDLRNALKSGKKDQIDQAVEQINIRRFSPVEQDVVVMHAICQAAISGHLGSCIRLSSQLNDTILKEECYLLIAGLAALHGKTETVETHIAEVSQASEKVVLCWGLVVGQKFRSSRPGPASKQ